MTLRVTWKKAWQVVLERAGLDYRWHDARHTFVSRLCENPAVSETTIMALAGHVSKRMMERYSHVRTQAKRDPRTGRFWHGVGTKSGTVAR
ncbi:MAG: tyrosine-type recombinase/integrase, partial [Terriglobia bacterium]